MHGQIEHAGKPLSVKKCIACPDFSSQTVLTDSAWSYIESYLKQNREDRYKTGLFYWQQARNFAEASLQLDENSKPLTNYYCFLNAAKCLLILNGVSEEKLTRHGVSGVHNSGYTILNNEIVIFKGGGVLYELEHFLGEDENKQKYNLKDLLYNIPYIHRAYSITYRLTHAQELFIPIYNIRFVRKAKSSEAWLDFEVEDKYQNSKLIDDLGHEFERDNGLTDKYAIRKKKRFKWDSAVSEKKRIESITRYHKLVRSRLFYIYGSQRLWYIKKDIQDPNIINHSSIILTFACMHKLSEICRYQPKVFDKHLHSKHSWLLTEFINKASSQFIDEIASEISGKELMPTGFRS